MKTLPQNIRRFKGNPSAMTRSDLKKRLIEKIQEVDDQNLLEEIYRLLGIEVENPEELKLTKDQVESIKRGQQDIEKGNALTKKQADEEIDRWLNG